MKGESKKKNEILDTKIRKLRIEKGYSQKEMAVRSNMSQSAYVKIEYGWTPNIFIEAGKNIAKALGVSFNELFDIDVIEGRAEINALIATNEMLKKKINELEEQLQDKKIIIKHLNIQLALSSRDSLAIVIDTGKEIIEIYNRELLEPETLINRIHNMPLEDDHKQRLITTVSNYRI